MTVATIRRHQPLRDPQGLGRELVIIDTRIDQWEMLAAGVRPDCEVVALHPQEDGIEQITQLLSCPDTAPLPRVGVDL